MKSTFYTKEEINRAIFKVLTTKYKKDAKEAHSIVEEVGYQVRKWDGTFDVQNPKTNRYVKIEINEEYNRGKLFMMSGRKYFKSLAEITPFDFVGQLETTHRVYYEPICDESEAYVKYHKIKDCDYMATSCDNDIKQTLKKIEGLQKDLIRYTEWKIEYEAKANNYRKEYGLK